MVKQLLLAEIGKNIKEIDRNLDWQGYYPVIDEDVIVGVISVYADAKFEIDAEKQAVPVESIKYNGQKPYYTEKDFDLDEYFYELAKEMRSKGGNCLLIDVNDYEFEYEEEFREFIEIAAKARFIARRKPNEWIFELL